jgi:hypothetical protein
MSRGQRIRGLLTGQLSVLKTILAVFIYQENNFVDRLNSSVQLRNARGCDYPVWFCFAAIFSTGSCGKPQNNYVIML